MIKKFYNIWIVLFLCIGSFSEPGFREDSTKENGYFKDSSIQDHYYSNFSQNSFQSTIFEIGPVTATVDPSFAAICTFEELQLTASGSENYLWIPNPGNPSGGALSAYNIPNPIFSNGFAGSFYVYDVIVSDNNFPSNADTTTVIISIRNNPFISISPSPGIFVCENEEVFLTANGGVSYLWENAVTGDSLGQSETLQANPSTTTTYRAIGTDANGCWEYNDLTIFVEEVSAFAIADEPGVCEGGAVILTGGTGDQLTWVENGNTIGSGNSINVSPTVTTTYDLIVQNSSGCEDSTQVTVEYYESPEVLNPFDYITNCDANTVSVGIQISQTIENYSISSNGAFENNELHGNLLTFDAIYTGYTSSFEITFFGGNGGCSVVESFQFVPCECYFPNILSVEIEEAKCDGKNGGAVINLLNPDSYSYSWDPNLGISYGAGNERLELPSGVYNVEITDTSNLNCSSFVNVFITNSNGPQADFNSIPATCSAADGTVILNPSNYTYEWEDSVISNSRTDLSTGIYLITIADPLNPECSNVINVEVGEENPLLALLAIDNTPDCAQNNGSVSFQILNGSGDYTFSWQDNFTTTNNFRNELSAGQYEVTITDNSTPYCGTTSQFVLSANTETAEISLINIDDVSCYGYSDGGIEYQVVFDTSFVFDADTIITDGLMIYENGNLSVGEYCLYLIDGDGCIVRDVCFEIEEPNPMGLLLNIAPDCFLGGEISLTVSGGKPPYTYDWDDIAGINNDKDRDGLTAGDYSVTVSDSEDCDFVFNFITIPTCSEDCDFLGGTDTLNLELEDCFGIAEYCFSVSIDDLQNCQILVNDELFTDQIISCQNDTFSNGYLLYFEPGIHEVIIFDTLNDCFDRLVAKVKCSNSDEICINEIKEFCINPDDLNLIGEIASMTNVCQNIGENPVEFEIDFESLCVSYEGNNIGNDTVCIEICDLFGNCESIELRITVENCLVSSNDFFKDTVLVNETAIFCPDTTELPGNIISINNFCPDQSGDFVDFFLDPINFCFEYSGLAIGIDSACIEICDDLGFCDTTMMCIVVEEDLLPPIAIDDCDTTNMGAPVVINVLTNDTIFGRLNEVNIVSEPIWGAATVNLDRSITYNASDEFCERIDSFQYEVCTDAGCDTASVCVWIACVDIFIFTAISPNRDGVNDIFYIAGIEDYPESILRIFNRWGNLVYEKKNYKNTWSGTYNSSTDLPDGTYFYLLELNDEDKRFFKGYLELFR